MKGEKGLGEARGEMVGEDREWEDGRGGRQCKMRGRRERERNRREEKRS